MRTRRRSPRTTTASRVTTPWRSSSVVARAWPRSVGDALLADEVGHQRPAPGGARRPERQRPVPGVASAFDRERGSDSARSGAKVSFVTSPAQTRSHSASSSSSSLRASATAARSCGKNDAPRRWRCCADRVVDRSRWPVLAGARALASRSTRSRRIERDPPVVAAERAAPDPDDLAGRAELVEQARRVAGHAGRQHVALEDRCGKRHALELATASIEPPEAAGRRADPVPRRQEAGERLRLDRLDLAAEARQRAAAQLAQDVGIGELVGRAAGSEGALQQRRRRRPSRAAAPRRGARPMPHRAAGSSAVKGAWVRAQRARSASSGRSTGVEERLGHARRWAERRPRRGSAPRPRPRSSAPRRRSAPGSRGASASSSPSASGASSPLTRARRPRRSAGRRAGAAGRRRRRSCEPGASAPAPGARARGRPPRPGRSARAAPRCRAARRAARGRAPAPAPGARRAARRPRT